MKYEFDLRSATILDIMRLERIREAVSKKQITAELVNSMIKVMSKFSPLSYEEMCELPASEMGVLIEDFVLATNAQAHHLGGISPVWLPKDEE